MAKRSALSPFAIMPAAVTPMRPDGKVDDLGLAKLLAWFEACGCDGVVLAGTNGEGPSLSAPEKRDLIFASEAMAGRLKRILGIATSSLEEAIWLCKQAGMAHADAVLVMPPMYFRPAPESGVAEWFRTILDRSPVPVLLYNFPKNAGFTITPNLLRELGSHGNLIGAKDSSGEKANLAAYREALGPDRLLYVGNETLLIDALESGWNGSISGAANVLGEWLSAILRDWTSGERESAEVKFDLALPLIEALRSMPQPASNKAMLSLWGVLPSATVRLPLLEAELGPAEALLDRIRDTIGLRP